MATNTNLASETSSDHEDKIALEEIAHMTRKLAEDMNEIAPMTRKLAEDMKDILLC